MAERLSLNILYVNVKNIQRELLLQIERGTMMLNILYVNVKNIQRGRLHYGY